MSVTRRAFLGAAAAAGAGLLWSRGRSRAAPDRPGNRLLFVILAGGYDTVLTTDPKNSHSCGSTIDCGYRPAQMLRGKRRLYGPLFGGLMAHEQDLAIVHGIRLETVAHPTAFAAMAYGRLHYASSDGSMDVALSAPLARRGGTIPILRFAEDGENAVSHAVYREVIAHPHWFSRPRSLAAVAAGERQAHRVFADDAARAAHSSARDQTEQLEGFFGELAHTPNPFVDPQLGPRFHMALTALAGGHASYVEVCPEAFWFDSHSNNLSLQTQRTGSALRDLGMLISELQRARDPDGVAVWERTTLVVASEMGRFPRLNPNLGKDHWPETTWMFGGRGIRREPGGLTIGRTDDRLRGLDVDFRTGSTRSGGRRPLLLDNVFATLVQLTGGTLRDHGYRDSDVVTALLAAPGTGGR